MKSGRLFSFTESEKRNFFCRVHVSRGLISLDVSLHSIKNRKVRRRVCVSVLKAALGAQGHRAAANHRSALWDVLFLLCGGGDEQPPLVA